MKEKLELLPQLLPFIAVIVGVVYALYGGIATPSEAAGVGAALCLVMVIGDLPRLEADRSCGRSCATACASRACC